MDGPHDQTLFWGWIPILDPGLDLTLFSYNETPPGIEKLSENQFAVLSKSDKKPSKKPYLQRKKDKGEEEETTIHMTTFLVAMVDNFIVLKVLGGKNNAQYVENHAQYLYDFIKGAYHNHGCHSFGNGLKLVKTGGLEIAISETFEQLNRKSYYDDAAGDFNMIVDTNYHLSYVAHTEYMIPFLQRYRRFFDPFFVELMTDKAKTRLIQAKRYLETYTAIESVRMENSSRKMSMAALLVSMFSMIVAIGALFDDVWVTATMVALAVGIMLGMFSDIHGIIRKKLTRNPVRKNDGKG